MFRMIFWAVLALDLLFWWWADRRARQLPRPTPWRVAIALFAGFQLGYLLLSALVPGFRHSTSTMLPPSVMAVLYLWHLLVLPVWLVLAILWGSGATGVSLVRRWKPVTPGPATEPTPEAAHRSWTRRDFLLATAATAPPLMTLGLTGLSMTRLSEFRIREMEVSLANLPPALDGLRIAHVTDVHVGRYTRGAQLLRIAEATNRLEADLVLLTGDLLDQSISDLPEALDFVGRLDPRQGLAMCEGNHDLIGDGSAFRWRTKAAGVPLLVDESRTLIVRDEPIQLLGLSWSRGEERIVRSTHNLLRLRDPAAFPILLAHHPHAFDPAAAGGVPLTLSGHTHGGQLMLNERLGAGPAMFRYWTGLYEQGPSKLVVSNGAGNWFPLRTAAPAEIVHLTLRRA